jgi:DNA gyrase subunit B
MMNHCSKVILAASTSAKKAREMVQRKTVMGGGGLPGKLSDCSEQDPANETVEGKDSASVSKNFERKAMHHKVFENEEIRDIF